MPVSLRQTEYQRRALRKPRQSPWPVCACVRRARVDVPARRPRILLTPARSWVWGKGNVRKRDGMAFVNNLLKSNVMAENLTRGNSRRGDCITRQGPLTGNPGSLPVSHWQVFPKL